MPEPFKTRKNRKRISSTRRSVRRIVKRMESPEKPPSSSPWPKDVPPKSLEAAEQYRRIVENINDALVVHDFQGRILDVNEHASRITGFTRAQLLGMKVQEMGGHPQEAAGTLQNLARDGSAVFEADFTRKDGSIVWVSVSSKVVTSEGGGVVQAFMRDITPLKLAEDAIRRTNEQYRSIVEHAGLGIVSTDLKGHIAEANPAFETMLGYSRGELRGIHVWKISHPEEDVEQEGRDVQEMAEKSMPVIQRFKRYVRKDGSTLWANLLLSVVRDEKRQPQFVIGLVEDISERRKQEEEIRRLAAAVEQTRDAIVVLGSDGALQYVNTSFERITGFSVEELRGQSIRYFLSSLAPELLGLYREIGKILQTGNSWSGRFASRRKDKVPYDAEATISPVSDASGRHVSSIAIIRDITEQVQRDAELQRLGLAVSQVADGIMILGPDTRIQYVNRAFELITGYSREEVMDKAPDFLSSNPETTELKFHGTMLPRMMQEGSCSTDEPLHRKDGTLGTVEITVSPIRDASGGMVSIVSVMRDVTDKLRQEEELRRLATAVGQVNDGVIITDIQQKIIYVNPAFERLTGYSRNEATGQHPSFLIPSEEAKSVLASMQEKIMAGENWSGRFHNRRKDGSLFLAEVSLSLVRDPGGRPVQGVSILRDITEKVALEERLQQAQKMESIGHLAGGVAHDFNNLLAPILGYVQMLMLKSGVDHPFHADLLEIEKAAYRGRDLSRQLLTFSRKQVVEMHAVHLADVLEGFQRMLRRTIREDIELKIFAEAKCRVLADASQIELILMNLVINAQDAMPKGGIITLETKDVVLDEMYVGSHPGAKAGAHVMLSVSDTGGGMDAEMMKHLFEPFYTTKDKNAGTGLGLASVYGIVSQHNGSIGVYSEPGRGTSFKIYFPCVEAAAQASPDRPSGLLKKLEGTEKVLVCEDNMPVRELVAKALRNLGYAVFDASSADECAKLFEEQGRQADLLLTDVIMPGMNGRELYNRLAAVHPDLRVLYMSGYTQNVIAQHGVLEDGVHFIQKPFTLEALARKVRETLDR